MFLDPENDDNLSVMILNGTECEYLDFQTFIVGGMENPIYKLNCSGKTGFVNQPWVERP